ncbi:hypothetical protein J6590_049830 [Homalodisca vitripennis]|nr:hypothetical protein J6590_049830 [Homalodisca vitripennis]
MTVWLGSSRQKQEDLSPLSPGVDDVLMNFDHLGTTPPRTRIRNKDKSRREKDASTKPAPRIIYSGRSSSEKNFFSRNNSESFDDEGMYFVIHFITLPFVCCKPPA